MAEDTVHVGKGSQKRKARWPFIVALAATAMLALGAGVGIRWYVNRDDPSAEKADDLPPALQEVQDLALNGDQAGADAVISASLADPATPADVKFSLYMQQAANYYEQGNYRQAIASYESAFAIRQTFELAQSLASTYQQIGDKQQAISYLKKAIELMPANNPVREDDVALIEEQIRTLEAGQ